MCGCSCGAGSEEGLREKGKAAKSSCVALGRRLERGAAVHFPKTHVRFVGNRRGVQKERMVEMFDFQSLYVSLMFLCFLQRQKAGVRIGTYFFAHFLF